MKYVVLPDERMRPLSFYLATEDYLGQNMEGDDLLMLWQVEPSVIYGRNQAVENEVNLDYCRENGIRVYQRKSGGGCVYADRDNVMMSFVTPSEDVALTFNRFIGMLLLVLRKLGIEATSTTHNDVMIGGRKVSGTAFYHLPGRSIVHATMLYDTNMEHMLNAITPGPEKLEAKGIKSVRQRITLLRDHIPQTLEEFKTFVKATLCEGERMLTQKNVEGIEQLEQTYLREDFLKLLNH